MDKNLKLKENPLLDKISSIIEQARRQVVTAVNLTVVYTYYEIGRYIVEDEQQGEQRAEYGKAVLKELSERLTEKYGRGFSIDNLKLFRKLFQTFQEKGNTVSSIQEIVNTVYEIPQAVSAELEITKNQINNEIFETVFRKSALPKFVLSWSHYIKLMRIADPLERSFCEIGRRKQNRWHYSLSGQKRHACGNYAARR